MALIALFVVGYVSARIALYAASLVNPDRLVPVSGADVLRAAPLMLVLYLVGSALVIRFPIPQAAGWYTLFFAVRIVAALLLSMIFQFDDERAFHYAGMEQVYGIVSFEAGRAYYHLVNVLYSIFGPNILLPKMVNAFLGSLLPYFAFDIAHWLFAERKIAWRAFLFTGLLPPFVIFSAVNLKEIATGFLLVLLVWVLANPRVGYLRRLVGCGVCILGLYWLRGSPLAVGGIMGVIVHYIFSMRLRFSSFVKVALVIGLSGLLLPTFLHQIQQTVSSRTTQEQYFIERFSESEATVMRFLDIENPLSGTNLSVLFLRGLFSPSPLRFVMDYGIDTLLEGLNMLVWYILFPMAVMGLSAYRWKGAVAACGVIGVAVLIIAMIGVVVGSDPYRHRIMAMGLVSILAAAGFEKDIMRRYRWITWLWLLGAAAFTSLWLILRL
jgi:hypothetical protein